MRAVLVFFFALLPVIASASGKRVATATAPGCGTDNVKFDVKTDRSQDPLAKPEPGKALAYFLQDDSHFLSVPRPTTRLGLDGWVGATQSNAYFYLSVDPGEHHVCAGWQSFVGFTNGQTQGAAHFTAEASNSYFSIVRKTEAPRRRRFNPSTATSASFSSRQFGFSTSHPRK